MATGTAAPTKTPEQIAAEAQQTAGAAGNPQTTAAPPVNQTVQQQQQQAAATPVSKDPAVQAQTTKPTPTTASTTPPATPASSVGSNLPAYAAAYNAPWMQQANNPAMPGANTTYQAPGSLAEQGIDYSKAQYNPNGVQGPQWDNQGANWNDQDQQWNGTAKFNDPNGNSQAAYDALQSILGGDASGMDTSAMKNRLKEQALMMSKDQNRSSRQAAAGRGMLDSGHQASQERRIAGNTQKDILGGFRDIDIAAAQESTKNKLAGSEALNSLLTGDTSRENTAFQAKLLGEDTGFKNRLQGADTAFKNKLAGADTAFNNQLEGAKFKEGQQQFGSKFELDKQNDIAATNNAWQQQRQAGANSALNSYQAGQDASFKGKELDLQVANQKTNELLGRMGLAVNLEEIKNSSNRDKQQFLVDIFRTLVQNEQHNAQMGLSYGQLGQSMNEMITNVAKTIGM